MHSAFIVYWSVTIPCMTLGLAFREKLTHSHSKDAKSKPQPTHEKCKQLNNNNETKSNQTGRFKYILRIIKSLSQRNNFNRWRLSIGTV